MRVEPNARHLPSHDVVDRLDIDLLARFKPGQIG